MISYLPNTSGGPVMKNRERILTLTLLFAVTSILVQTSAFAKSYIRQCSARVSVGVIGGTGLADFTFIGKGKVGYRNRDEARRRARRNIDECLNAHWNSSNPEVRPSQCTSSNRVYNYPTTNMSRALCTRNPNNPNLSNIVVIVNYSGHGGCKNGTFRYVVRNKTIRCYTPGCSSDRNENSTPPWERRLK